MIKNINFLFVTFFGLGTIRYAPGTIASLITTILFFSFFHIIELNKFFILIIILITIVFSIFSVAFYIKDSQNKDPKEVVIDEFIGQSLPIYMYEISHNNLNNYFDTILIYLYIFLLFRFFDILKPFPINYIDKKMKNSFGIIFDDIIAGLYVIFTIILFMTLKINFLT
tara:strand:+ start:248 stop:754 length:507 start_codon:yes stop_codon:yes gene_type:complete